MDENKLNKLIDDFQFETKKYVKKSQDVDTLNSVLQIAVNYIIKAYKEKENII